MAKLSTALGVGAVALGAVALYMLPIGRLLLLYASLGMAPLTVLMFVEGMVALARVATPWRTVARFHPGDIERADLPGTVILYELGVSVVALLLLAATARWWQPLLGVRAPIWLFVMVAVRTAGTAAMTAIALLKRPLAALVGLVDMIVVLPLVAIFGHSLEAVAIGSLVITWLLLIFLAMRAPTLAQIEKTLGKKVSSKASPERTVFEGRWPLGSWLGSVSGTIKRPLFVAIAGAAVVLPFSAASIVGSLLALPFVAFAVNPKLPRSRVLRAAIGVVLAGLAFLVVRELGPATYRAVYPDSFGDGRWLRLLAWGSVGILPLALRGESTKASQLQEGIIGVLFAGLMIGLSLVYGTPGFLVGCSLGVALNATISLSNRETKPLFSD